MDYCAAFAGGDNGIAWLLLKALGNMKAVFISMARPPFQMLLRKVISQGHVYWDCRLWLAINESKSIDISFELSPAKGTLLNWSRFFDESAFLFFDESPASKGIASNKLLTLGVRTTPFCLLYRIPSGNSNTSLIWCHFDIRRYLINLKEE